MSLTLVKKVKRMREIRANCGVCAFVPFNIEVDLDHFRGEFDFDHRVWRLSPSDLDQAIAEYERILAERVAALLETE